MTYLHVDLCCGLGGWQAPFIDSDGWRSVGIDIRRDLSPDVQGDVRAIPLDCDPTLVTASPPCTQFSRWDMPWHDEPNPSLELVEACLSAVERLSPERWALENVRGLHRYWEPAQKHVGPFYLWGNLPPFDCGEPRGKMQVSGRDPEERAKIPYALADALRIACETWGGSGTEPVEGIAHR